jgi:hypothetical protein
VPPEIKIVEHSESITSEMKLRKHEVIDQRDESVTRHSDVIFPGSDLRSDYSQQRKPPGRQLFIEPTGVSLEWIKSEEKAAGSLPLGSIEHGMDDNASPGRSRAKHAPSISEVPRTAIEGYSTRSLTGSSLIFGTGSETYAKGGSSGGFTAGASGGTAGGPASGGRVSASKVTGVVVWGSAAAIAAWGNSPILSAHVLLQYVKERMFADIYDGSAISVARQRKAVRNLEVIIFMDTIKGVGLWVDVDPTTQDPAAALLIKIDPDNTLKPVRFFRYEP